MEFTCLNCGITKPKSRGSAGKYCGPACQQEYQTKQKVLKWLAGEEPGYTGKAAQLKPFVRKWLWDTRGTACEVCGWDGKHPIDGAVLTEVDHIDGDATNCSPENLKILCPNCHSMTPTHRARNRVSTRQR
ncbi:putative endonuclease [Escherichia phage vB_EcoS_HdH2]|uniref:Putative endonuclease n=1 Tax=Escherichia phage vB_EcoS_HdH2 TaxID=2508174 RepID=A0A482N3P4_9CAUD|nr:HNH endonuclease [Escherichia phage vB_EcoS_HdH2]QBQ81157.1 putative endonuclease [Escherichia phage vB_EcoS_HdH2]